MRLTWDRQCTGRKTVSVASLKLTEVSVKKIGVMHCIKCIKMTSKVRREKGVFVVFVIFVVFPLGRNLYSRPFLGPDLSWVPRSVQ